MACALPMSAGANDAKTVSPAASAAMAPLRCSLRSIRSPISLFLFRISLFLFRISLFLFRGLRGPVAPVAEIGQLAGDPGRLVDVPPVHAELELEATRAEDVEGQHLVVGVLADLGLQRA